MRIMELRSCLGCDNLISIHHRVDKEGNKALCIECNNKPNEDIYYLVCNNYKQVRNKEEME